MQVHSLSNRLSIRFEPHLKFNLRRIGRRFSNSSPKSDPTPDSLESDSMSKDENEDDGWILATTGKLPFAKPGSGGKQILCPTNQEMIPESQGGELAQPWGSHRHDNLVGGQIIGKPTALVDGKWKVTGQAPVWGRYQIARRTNRKNYSITSSLCSGTIHRFSKALELPGVVAIAAGADAENKFGVLPVTKDEHAMAVEMVRHVGDLVACVGRR